MQKIKYKNLRKYKERVKPSFGGAGGQSNARGAVAGGVFIYLFTLNK